MSGEDPGGSREFAPVKLRPHRRRIDPVLIGLAFAAGALVLAVLKPWGGVPGIAAVPSSDAASPGVAPTGISTPAVVFPPTWADVRSVVSPHEEWGIRAIVAAAEDASAAPPGPSDRFAEHWVPAASAGSEGTAAVVGGDVGGIFALGVTFPSAETPLDVRIWLTHAGGELEWLDALPIDQVPGRGAYLYLRPSAAGAPARPWAPGSYRMDVLVNGGIKRIDVDVPGPSGRLPAPDPWPRGARSGNDFDPSSLAGLPVGPFAERNGAPIALQSAFSVLTSATSALDEAAAWLDVDPETSDRTPVSSVARAYVPDATGLGVVLPADATIRTAWIRRVAPSGDATAIVSQSSIGSSAAGSYVVFSLVDGAVLRPGVYAMAVSWEEHGARHDATWHIELHPGPLPAVPVLLTATRDWARYAGSSGLLLGSTDSLDGTPGPSSLRLLDVAPQTGRGYPGLDGSNLIGCGSSIIHGRPTLIGMVAPAGTALSPIAARILFPLADTGSVGVLTASGSVAGLTLISPVVTAEFGGPAAYGFRAGPGGDGPGYTICVGFAIGAR